MPDHPTWQSGLLRAWQRRGGLARLLWPLSQVYHALWRLREWRYRMASRPQPLPVPLVVVGNVVVGGAGKTPTTIALVQHWLRQGRRPGVVSKGHGRQRPAGQPDVPVLVRTDSPAVQVGDEPLLIHQATGVPVVVGPDRTTSAQHLLAQHPQVDVLICDDGLQDLSLQPDVRILVFDDRGIGNGWLLPAGMLRQPWPTPTTRPGDVALFAPTDAPGLPPNATEAPPLPPGMPLFHARRALADTARNPLGQRVALQTLLDDAPCHALAGIARPDAFFDMLRARGARLSHTWALNDHHALDSEFNSKLFNQIKRERLFLTEKDAVKLFPLLSSTPAHGPGSAPLGPDAWAVPLVLEPETDFYAAVDARLSSPHGPQTA
ncbi:MAG TPA: tetraacyldisaccharide 4'-kinase [Burkholderiaceae bacterium]|nr:tetraacyldisaccharide 4'-kinase [Burkholderiaceae bacterium]